MDRSAREHTTDSFLEDDFTKLAKLATRSPDKDRNGVGRCFQSLRTVCTRKQRCGTTEYRWTANTKIRVRVGSDTYHIRSFHLFTDASARDEGGAESCDPWP